MTDQNQNRFAIIRSKFTDSASSWRIVSVVKKTEKSIFIPGYGKPDRIDADRVVAEGLTQAQCDEIVLMGREVEASHQQAVGEAMIAAAEVDAKAKMDREAAIQEARRVYDIATRETKAAVRAASQAQMEAVAQFVASKIGGVE